MLPFILYNFELSSYCNAGCPSCFRTSLLDGEKYSMNQSSYMKKLKHLSIDDFQYMLLNNIEFFKKRKYEQVVAKFCGEVGDPMMHPQLDQLIGIASTVFDKVEIFTNGGLRNSNWIKKMLIKYKKLFFIFGIDGVTDEVNQKYRVNVRTDIAFENMIQSAKLRFTKWDFTIFEHNWHQLQDAIDLASDHKIYILARVNGRAYSKISDQNLIEVEEILKKNKTNYYLCKTDK
tara:strand:- start:2257 stop:2952 length:696 start_codon:yes stop_codon:yes gene_type:complete